MFLVTMFHLEQKCKLNRKVFLSLSDAEEFCDYYGNLGWIVWGLDRVDTALSDMFATCGE